MLNKMKKLLSAFMVLCMLLGMYQPISIPWGDSEYEMGSSYVYADDDEYDYYYDDDYYYYDSNYCYNYYDLYNNHYRYFVRGFVWEDIDGDGKKDVGEPGVQGINVYSYWGNGNQYFSKATTSSDGSYIIQVSNRGNDNVIKVKSDELENKGYELTNDYYKWYGYGSKVNLIHDKKDPVNYRRTDKFKPSNYTYIGIGLGKKEGTTPDPEPSKPDQSESDLIDVTRSISETSIKQGESVDVKYTITPKQLNKVQKDNDNVKKDVVLVIDTSGSMADYGKISSIKNVAKNFVDKFEDVQNVKIGVVEYSTYARKVSGLTSDVDYVKREISYLGTGGATNIGDGVRTAKSILDQDAGADEKYIILMTDGEATAYSRDINGSKSSNWTYLYSKNPGNRPAGWDYIHLDDYMGPYINNDIYHGNLGPVKPGYYVDYYISYLGPQGTTDETSLSYAKSVAAHMVKDDQSVKALFVVGFGTQAGSSNAQIAGAAGAKGSYYSANDSFSLQSLYEQFAQRILTSAEAGIQFEEKVINESSTTDLHIKVENLPQGFEFDDGTVKGNLTALYSLNSNESGYIADPIEFTVRYTFDESGTYKFGNDDSSLVKISVLNEEDSENIPEATVDVEANEQLPPRVKMDVHDANGTVYQSMNEDGTENLQILEEGLILKGDAVSQLEIKGETIKDARYKIIKLDTEPSMPSDGNMIPINDSIVQKIIYPDLIKDKIGYLTARNYDVSHLGTMTEEGKWNDRSIVFKNPTSVIEQRSADTAYAVGDYITKVNGRFKNYTIFMDNMNVGGNGGPYPDYKESAKFWGYITPPQTGDYYFGTRSDDGSKGYIIVDDEKLTIADQFKIQGSTFKTDNVKMHLEAGKFYPIYLEYSNWGGWADHRLIYRTSPFISSTNDGGGQSVPANWFRPTSNNKPGEVATATFESTAVKGIPFPEESGIYYVAVKAKNEKNAVTEKICGPFVVGLKSDFEISRESEGFVQNGEFFELKYKVTPGDIKIGDIGKNLIIQDFKIQETFPDGVALDEDNEQFDVDGQTIVSKPQSIEYRREGGVYKADPFEVSVRIKIDSESQSILIGENESAFASYTDFDESSISKSFEEMTINISQFVKPEEFNVLEIQPEREFELTEEMFADMGHSVTVDQMSMREFVGNVEDINGKYDVVYIGNKNEGGANNDHYSPKGKKSSKVPPSSGSGVEYYSENDITNRKAYELEEYIESGQLLVLEKNILNGSMKDMKLYKRLSGYEDRENVIDIEFVNSNNSLERIISEYRKSNKRPAFEVVSSPKEYDGLNYEENKNMQFKYNIKNQNSGGQNLIVTSLYLDQNGDGFFREDEKVEHSNPQFDGEGYVINYRIEDSFTGMMPWKVEAVDQSAGTKSYHVGYPAYKGKKLKTRVLHLIPENGTELHIKNGNGFTPSLNTDEYEIQVTELPVSMFNNSCPNDVEYGGKTVKTELNGNYDMIVMGFRDMYGSSDIIRNEPIQAIKDFIKTGQSVMFTHDVFTFWTNNSSGWGANITKQFRDIAGQSRYKDPNNPAELDVWGNRIMHDEKPEQNKKTYGFSDGALDRANGKGFKTYNNSFMLNEGIITKYPYDLPNILPVATTHYQYFQLNLEDEDVVPWFSLYGGANSKLQYDGRNNYYTYTKGNITYSGTGHSRPGGIPEQEFFVNTMVKASRNSNHAPTINVINLDENDMISTNQDMFEFSFIPDDIDGDELTGKIYINDVLVRSYSKEEVALGEPIRVQITKEELQEIIGDGNSFELSIEVVDSKGAKAEENSSFTVSYIENPVLFVSAELSERGYLVGDRGSVDISIEAPTADRVFDSGATNLDFAVSNSHGIDFDHRTWTPSDVSFNPLPSHPKQTKEFEFTVEDEGSHIIQNRLEYDCSDFEGLGKQTVDYSYAVPVKKGRIDVSVSQANGKAVENGSITVKRPDGTTSEHRIENGIVSLEYGMISGTYEISVNPGDGYSKKEGGVKNVTLSYEDNSQEIEFTLINKDDISLELASNGPTGCLVGDTVTINMTAYANSGDDNVSTSIRNINYRMGNSSGLELKGDSSWNIDNVNIDGSNISNDNQSKAFKFEAASKGRQSITGTVVYDYLNGENDARSVTHDVDVKSGLITVQVESASQNPFAHIDVTVSGNGYEETIKTDETGKCIFSGMPSGDYTVSAGLPTGVMALGGNTKQVTMSYENSEESVQFEVSDKVQVFTHGKFANGEVVEVGDIVVPKGIAAELGIDVEFYGNTQDQEIILTLDPNVTSSTFMLYDLAEDGSIAEVLADPNNPDKNMKIYRVTEPGIEEGPLTAEQINDILSNSDEKVQFKIVPPDNGGRLDNHYLIKYTVEHNMKPGETLQNEVTVNGSEPKNCVIRFANSLIYT